MTITATATKTTYSIDKAHSEATFQVRHLLSRVRGRFSDFEGTIDYDEQNPEYSSVNVAIQAASIDTTERDRDTHLRSADFFEVEVQPDKTPRSPGGTDGFDVAGDLTIRGITAPVIFDVPSGQGGDPWGAADRGRDDDQPEGLRIAVERGACRRLPRRRRVTISLWCRRAEGG